MNAPTKEWGDVASTISLAQYIEYHLMHHKDVTQTRSKDSVVFCRMADGSEILVQVSSNYAKPSAFRRGKERR